MLEMHQQFGGVEQAPLHPVLLGALVIAIVLVFLLPRQFVLLPLLFLTIVTPLSQGLMIFSLNFSVLRIMVMVGWIRLFGELLVNPAAVKFRLNSLDKVFFMWGVSSVVTFSVLWSSWGAFIHQMGFLYNAFGVYFLMRVLIRDPDDVDRVTKIFAMICGVLAILMVCEQVTGKNPLNVIGGIHDSVVLRGDRLRSQAGFGHAILAGVFGATLFPLFVGLWSKGGRSRATAFVGLVASSVIVFTAASSTPVLAYLAGIGALCIWPFRERMRVIRWGVIASLVTLHIVMNAPVWALIARVGVVTGSTGYHRYRLVDEFITRIGTWWLFGTKDYWKWDWNMWDTTNQYVAIGWSGGLITLILFFAIIWRAFQSLGVARKAAKDRAKVEFPLWAMCCGLFSHLVAFMGIAYFDQTVVAWYVLLAMIPAATMGAIETSRAQPQPPADVEVVDEPVPEWQHLMVLRVEDRRLELDGGSSDGMFQEGTTD